jgi:hypothetical protein
LRKIGRTRDADLRVCRNQLREAGSRWFSEDAFKRAGSRDKSLHIVEGATHIAMYDTPGYMQQALAQLVPLYQNVGKSSSTAAVAIQGDRISVLAPLAVGVVASICTTAIFLLPLRATIHLVRRQRSLGSIGMPWTDVAIFARVVFYASLGHLVKIGFWALLFMICREFRDFGTAFYHSAVNYTSLAS